MKKSGEKKKKVVDPPHRVMSAMEPGAFHLSTRSWNGEKKGLFQTHIPTDLLLLFGWTKTFSFFSLAPNVPGRN
jgi:hypothetical protein